MGAAMIFNLALLVIGVVGLLLVLALIGVLCGDWLQSFGFWED
jgi:hypothetical protein